MKHFYERNDYVLDHEVNKTFEEILWMSDDEFRQWLTDMRKTIAYHHFLFMKWTKAIT